MFLNAELVTCVRGYEGCVERYVKPHCGCCSQMVLWSWILRSAGAVD
jgi:hypothetical protein